MLGTIKYFLITSLIAKYLSVKSPASLIWGNIDILFLCQLLEISSATNSQNIKKSKVPLVGKARG